MDELHPHLIDLMNNNKLIKPERNEQDRKNSVYWIDKQALAVKMNHQKLKNIQKVSIPQITSVRWKRSEVIGKGAFGSVYKGFDDKLGIQVTIKQIPIGGIAAKDKDECIKELKQEIKMLSRLQHPNIVQYYGQSMTSDHINIFMEYVGDGSLKNKIEDFGPLSENIIKKYA